ncbi:C6 transcription factor [Purpureocillium lavendulum]|uniref:C6 transcription factor n=1 Tax=Purpureocillium lavendulum TaxID=1247861 RepID=A0AB34FZB0_9HYPO|nr:C6 transcription factor [Purpureocillium lavendulum]
MSGVQRHPHQAQHGPTANSQPFFQQPRDGAELHGGSGPIMDASHFADFAFPFSGLSEQARSHMMAMPDPSHATYDGATVAQFSQHQVLPASLPPDPRAMAPMTGMPASSLLVSSDNCRSSPVESDDDCGADRNSPTANTFEDPIADEFGLHSHGRGDGTDLGVKKDGKSDAPPAWSELKTKAGKDRKRLPLACIACRRKKIRCSGEKPACKHCLRSRIPCVYKVTTRKAAPRTDYMAMLDKRLKRMEERIIKIIPKTEQEGTPVITRAVVKPAIPGAEPSSKPFSKKRGADEAFGPDLEAWAKAPSKSKGVEAGNQLSSTEAQEEEEDKLSREGVDALPSKEVQEHLAEVFFDNVYGQAYHLLHKPSYMRKLRYVSFVRQDKGGSELTMLRNGALPPVLVLSVCAVAARFTPNPKISPSTRPFLRGEEWASQARDICTKRYEWPNITILTCLLILGLHEFGTCHGGRSWALGGQAIRMAFALQLHKDLEYDPLCRNKSPLSFIDREIRRRTMWACFLMDRFNSSGSDRPMFIAEESIKIQLPVKERFFQLDMPVQTESLSGAALQGEAVDDRQIAKADDSMGVAAYTIRSIAVWGRIIIYLNQGGREADSHPMWSEDSDYAALVHAMDEFVEKLPSALQYSPQALELQMTESTASQFLLLHLSIQQNILFLSQAAVTFANSRSDPEAPKDFLSRVSAKTFAAANRISEILRDAEQTQCHVSAPFAGYCAFSSTTIHIMGIFSGNATVKAAAETNSGVNIRFLRKMMRFWGMFHWMVENIRTQYRSALEASRSGQGDGASTSRIIQYGDWFNQYPHGVPDVDLADSTFQRKRAGEDGVLEQKPELQSVEEFFTTLSPAQTSDHQNFHRRPMAKTKQVARRQGDAPAINGEAAKAEAASRNTGQRRSPSHASAPQPARQFSSALVGQTSGPTGFSPAVPQTQTPTYTSMSPMSPLQVDQFPQQAGQNPFFSADMLSMNVPPQSGSLGPQLDRQISFSGFSMEGVGAVHGGAGAVGGTLNGWAGIPGKEGGQRSMKAEDTMTNGRHVQGQRISTPDEMSGFHGQDPSGGWFIPFGIETTGVDHNMALGGGAQPDPFSNVFGGSNSLMTQNQLDALSHSL